MTIGGYGRIPPFQTFHHSDDGWPPPFSVYRRARRSPPRDLDTWVSPDDVPRKLHFPIVVSLDSGGKTRNVYFVFKVVRDSLLEPPREYWLCKDSGNVQKFTIGRK